MKLNRRKLYESPPKGMNPHHWRKFSHAQDRMIRASKQRGPRRRLMKWTRAMAKQLRHLYEWIETPHD